MAEGKAVTLIPDNQVVTTQRTADILGTSRPFFIKLLETGSDVAPSSPQGYSDRPSLDMLIQSQNKPIENKEDKGLNSAKCGQVRRNPQTIRKQNGAEEP